MGAGKRAAGSGAVVGFLSVIMGQQLGLVDLSGLSLGVTYLVVATLAGAFVFGILGRLLGRRYLRQHAPVAEWKPAPVEQLPDTTEPPPPS